MYVRIAYRRHANPRVVVAVTCSRLELEQADGPSSEESYVLRIAMASRGGQGTRYDFQVDSMIAARFFKNGVVVTDVIATTLESKVISKRRPLDRIVQAQVGTTVSLLKGAKASGVKSAPPKVSKVAEVDPMEARFAKGLRNLGVPVSSMPPTPLHLQIPLAPISHSRSGARRKKISDPWLSDEDPDEPSDHSEASQDSIDIHEPPIERRGVAGRVVRKSFDDDTLLTDMALHGSSGSSSSAGPAPVAMGVIGLHASSGGSSSADPLPPPLPPAPPAGGLKPRKVGRWTVFKVANGEIYYDEIYSRMDSHCGNALHGKCNMDCSITYEGRSVSL
jgi:hypothetical protein